MRIRISGPSFGPVHTTLWSSGRKKRSNGTGLKLFLAAAGIGWAYDESLLLGIVATILLAVIAGYAARRAWKAL